MQITSDVTLKGPVWAEMLDRLVEEVFATNWDVYALCISIGMMYVPGERNMFSEKVSL